jgi:phage/plasmid-like protein (TIGR03299 family)
MAEMAAIEGLPIWWETKDLKAQRLTAKDAVDLEKVRIAAGMDFDIGRSRVRYGEGASQICWEDHHVLFRKDTKAPLGIVSPAYQIAQPRQILSMFADLVGVAGARIETAGTLYGGRQFWAMAAIDGAEFEVGKGDLVRAYLLAVTSADGSLKTTLTETMTAVVCENTMQAALGEKGARIVVGHRSELTEDRIKAMKTRLAESGKHFKVYAEAAKALVKARVSSVDAASFVETLLRDQKLAFAEDIGKSKAFQSIMALFDGKQLGGDLKARQGNLWGLVNAVTEHVDHHVKAKDQSTALSNMWFGKGDQLKSAAFAKALELV